MRFSRTRLSDVLHAKACAFVRPTIVSAAEDVASAHSTTERVTKTVCCLALVYSFLCNVLIVSGVVSAGGQSVARPPSAFFHAMMCVGTLRFAHLLNSAWPTDGSQQLDIPRRASRRAVGCSAAMAHEQRAAQRDAARSQFRHWRSFRISIDYAAISTYSTQLDGSGTRTPSSRKPSI